jgi:hypothetical protein
MGKETIREQRTEVTERCSSQWTGHVERMADNTDFQRERCNAELEEVFVGQLNRQ